MPEFSIIIPTYNGSKFLERAINSVLGQDFNNFEIIIVDDGSTDSTPEIIARQTKQFPETIISLSQQNSGPGAARNRGAHAARGNYLLFLDDDDELIPGALSLFHALTQKNAEMDFIFGGHISLDQTGRERRHPQKALSRERRTNFVNYICGRFGISQGEGVIRREILNHLHYPESVRNNEDVVFYAKVLALCKCMSFDEYVVIIHKRKESWRHNTATNIATGIKTADLLFDPAVLPAHLMKYKPQFVSRRYLSLFRTLYFNGRHREAKQAYHRAIGTYPQHLFQFSFLRKYLKLRFGFISVVK